MKKITLLMALFAMFSLSAQTVLTEDFDSGLTIPAGWTNNDIDGSGNVWTIATGGDAVGFESPNTIYYVNGGMTDNYALFDSDAYGGGPEEAALESPVFDCSALTSVTLKYNHFFTTGFGGSASVEVYNGSAWVEVASYAAATVFGLQNIDVTTHLAGVSNAQVRFKWSGNYSWGWAFDTVEVYSCTETATPACATVIAPTDAATDVATTESVDGLSRVVAFTWDAVPGALSYDFVFEGSTLTNVSTPSINITGLDYGTAYSWSIAPVNCFGATIGCATWTFTTEDAPAGPANDECVDAETISCGDTVSGTTLSATNSGNNASNDVWYVLAGTANGEEITASLCGSDFDSYIRIFDACEGIQVAFNDDATGVCSPQSQVTFTSDGATTYYIMVEGYGTNNGNFDLAITCVPAPACVAPIFTLTNGANNCPTLEFYVDVNVTNLGTGAAVNISDDSGVIETAVGLGTYSVGPYAAATLVNVTVEDTAGDTCNSVSAFTTPTVCPPSNDDCSGAIGLTVNADYACGTVTAGTTLGATASSQPDDVIGTPNNDVWFSFEASNTEHRISLTNIVAVAGSSVDMGIGVYDGTGTCAALTLIGSSDPETYNVSGLTIGTTYLVRVYGYFIGISSNTFDICVGTPPSCLPPTGLNVSNVTEANADLGWTENGTATLWDIEWGAEDFTPSGTPSVLGTTTNPYELSGLTASTSYDFYVRSDCGGGDLSAWTGPFTFATMDLPPACGDSFYDTGGASSNYGNNENYTITICPDVSGDFVTANFNSFVVEGRTATLCWDSLLIYDGSDNTGTPITPLSLGLGAGTAGFCWEAANDGTADLAGQAITATNPSGCLTFTFTSDGSGTRAGWDATISCATIGTQEYNMNELFTYYPNPVNSTLTLKGQKAIQNVAIYNMLGQEVLRIAPNTVDSNVDMSNLKAGTYFVKVTVENATKTIKIIKK